jgi:SAM-dependent methyltransferase
MTKEAYVKVILDLLSPLHSTRQETYNQYRHRSKLIEVWGVAEGASVLEIGCGHGETSVALAEAVGAKGAVIAVDSANRDYGSPATLGQAHDRIEESFLGSRIRFKTQFDVAKPGAIQQLSSEFGRHFDWAILAHSLWYFQTGESISRLLKQLGAVCNRVGVAEWDLVPDDIGQMPHLMSVVLQMAIAGVRYNHALITPAIEPNVRTVVTRDGVLALLDDAGWKNAESSIVRTSNVLSYGKRSEPSIALSNARHVIDTLSGLGIDGRLEASSVIADTLARLPKRSKSRSLNTFVISAAI